MPVESNKNELRTMKTPLENTKESQQKTIERVQEESSTDGEATIADNRPAIAIQRKLRSVMGSTEGTINPIQRKNKTGLPDRLKSGIENLSGYSMDDVKVYYNSSKPTQLQAHAYAQGTDIHLAPGQQKHLPHEAWHVVQQKQGRVKPMMQFKGKVNINDDAGLEKEADVMGVKAVQHANKVTGKPYKVVMANVGTVQRKINPHKLNLVGESHNKSEERRGKEKEYTETIFGAEGEYWLENEFKVLNNDGGFERFGDPIHLRVINRLTNIKLGIQELKDKMKKERSKNSPATLDRINELLDRLTDSIQQAYGLLNDHPDLTNGITYSENFIKRNKKRLYSNPHNSPENIIEILKNSMNSIRACKNYFSNNYPLQKKYMKNSYIDYRSALSALQNSYADIETINTPKNVFEINLHEYNYGYYLKKAFNKLRKSRSRQMHEAAMLMKHKKGVWTMGELHIVDIIKEYGECDDYNIENEESYNIEIDEFIESEK